MIAQQKEWTFLFYANGHNELEPETWRSVAALKGLDVGGRVNLVMQVAREEQPIIRLLRPGLAAGRAGAWSGTRRYLLCGQKMRMRKLKDVNMADPRQLYKFIVWGVSNYPAKRYLLSLAGHIYQFVGVCPDYSGDRPYMLGFPEISACLQAACVRMKMQLDILVLDTCYAGTVEILYELGRKKQPPVKTILTYIGKGPLEGLEYAGFLSILKEGAELKTDDLLKRLVERLPVSGGHGLIAFAVEHEVLQTVKQLFHRLAEVYLSCKEAFQKEFTPEELLSVYRSDYPWSLLLRPIHRLLQLLVIARRDPAHADGSVLPIHILYQMIPDEPRRRLYGRLAFSQENAWAALLCGIPEAELTGYAATGLQPLPVSKNILTAFVAAGNEQLSLDEQNRMVEELAERKGWTL